jgi:hypothetical protein
MDKKMNMSTGIYIDMNYTFIVKYLQRGLTEREEKQDVFQPRYAQAFLAE